MQLLCDVILAVLFFYWASLVVSLLGGVGYVELVMLVLTVGVFVLLRRRHSRVAH